MAVCYLAIAIVWFQVATGQHSAYSPRYYSYGRPVVYYSAGSDVQKTDFPRPEAEVQKTSLEASKDFEETSRPDSKVLLDVYYETDCPDSMRFITRQLYPMYRNMGDIVDINLIPYGKARESYNPLNQKYEFRCHHGPSECYGNTVQSCAISMYPETKDHLNFINCMETYPRPSQSGQKCARRYSLDWDKLEKCATGDEGNRLMHQNDIRTHGLKPALYFVPWIVRNKAFSETTQRQSLKDLQSVICEGYKGTHPKCSTTSV